MIEQAISGFRNFLEDVLIASKPYSAEDSLVIVDDAGWSASASRAVELMEEALAKLGSATQPVYVFGRSVLEIDYQAGFARQVNWYLIVDPTDPSSRVFLRNNMELLRKMQENESSMRRIPRHLDCVVRLI